MPSDTENEDRPSYQTANWDKRHIQVGAMTRSDVVNWSYRHMTLTIKYVTKTSNDKGDLSNDICAILAIRRVPKRARPKLTA
jgi:hypothetical protein